MPTPPTSLRGLAAADTWDHENGFYWFSDPRRIHKLLAHWELYRRIVDLPGDVVECGVYKAASLVRWATFRDGLEAARARRIVAFDAFGAFPRDAVSGADDRAFIDRFEAAGDGLSPDEVRAVLEGKGLGENVRLVPGDVRATIPAWLREAPATRIALLHLDMDVHEPTAFALEHLWDRVVPGGLLVIDDYNAVEGATRAVDAWLTEHPGLRLQKLPFAHVPSFVVKDPRQRT
jgi:hypothetical protein